MTDNYWDVWSFNRTLWNLLLKKFSTRLNREFEAPTDLGLNISPCARLIVVWFLLENNISNSFLHIGNNDTGLQLSIICFSPLLWIWQIFNFFQISGIIIWFIPLMSRIESGWTIAESNMFNILIEILSWSWAYLHLMILLC